MFSVAVGPGMRDELNGYPPHATMRMSNVQHPKPGEVKQMAPPSENKDNRGIHRNLKDILILAQVLGQLPVSGIGAPTPKSLSFKWRSWKTAYCIVVCVGSVFVALMLVSKMVKSGTNLFIITAFIFHMCRLCATVSFFHLAARWPDLMREWNRVEILMKSYGWPRRFNLRVRVITAVMLLATCTQYVISQTTNLIKAANCKEAGDSLTEFFYTTLAYPYIFTIVDYAIWKALILQLLEILTTLNGCYVDLFIMVMSTALALRFQQITERLQTDSKSSEQFWKEIREDYNRLCRLCKLLDDGISYIVLLSFGSNLFFILIQLFHSLRQINNTLDKVQFFFSFGFLILRTVYVSLFAAWVNDESKRPAVILNSVPSSVYNLEIRRFIQQISFDSVALTGRNFFRVTRGLILSVAGAIVTYELVLIQFNENLLKETEEDGCSYNK